MRAWLHRRGKVPWVFQWDESCERFVYRSRFGSTYAIFSDFPHKPFWVARLIMDGTDRPAWITVENQLGALSIEFEDAGVYTFPKGLK